MLHPKPISPVCCASAPPSGESHTGTGLAMVVFVDHTEGPWLRVLRPGFRHCFAVLEQDHGLWLIFDPLKHRIEIQLIEPPRPDELAEIYLKRGHRVCLGRRRVLPRPHVPPVPAPLTCVTIVKRLIGLRRRSIVTPFQLHRHLVGHPEFGWSEL